MNQESLKVACYSGYTCAGCPQSLEWQGRDYRVERIISAWQEPGERHFKIRTHDNNLFEIWYNDVQKQWLLIELKRSRKC